MSKKERLTITVDGALVAAGNDAVASGRAKNMSAWVSLALAERAAKDRRLQALGEAIAKYEARFGAITAEELAEQARSDRQSARVIRGKARSTRSRRRAA